MSQSKQHIGPEDIRMETILSSHPGTPIENMIMHVDLKEAPNTRLATICWKVKVQETDQETYTIRPIHLHSYHPNIETACDVSVGFASIALRELEHSLIEYGVNYKVQDPKDSVTPGINVPYSIDIIFKNRTADNLSAVGKMAEDAFFSPIYELLNTILEVSSIAAPQTYDFSYEMPHPRPTEDPTECFFTPESVIVFFPSGDVLESGDPA